VLEGSGGGWKLRELFALLSTAARHVFMSEGESVSYFSLSELIYGVTWLMFGLIMGA